MLIIEKRGIKTFLQSKHAEIYPYNVYLLKANVTKISRMLSWAALGAEILGAAAHCQVGNLLTWIAGYYNYVHYVNNFVTENS